MKTRCFEAVYFCLRDEALFVIRAGEVSARVVHDLLEEEQGEGGNLWLAGGGRRP